MATSGGGSGTTAVLWLCALTHSYLLFSVFPYAGYFALFLLGDGHGDELSKNDSSSSSSKNHLTVDNVGVYVGLLGSAFTFGRLAGFVPWKRIRTRHGERASLVASLLLSAAFSITFGASRTFPSALLSRFFLGASNGISGSIKRAAIKQARNKNGEGGDEEEVEWAISRVLSVMSFGCAFGPAVSGWFSRYNDDITYPYLPPNTFGAAMCVVSAALVRLVVAEYAHGDGSENSREKNDNPSGEGESKTLLAGSKSGKYSEPRDGGQANAHTSRGPIARLIRIASTRMEEVTPVFHAPSTRRHLRAYGLFSFCITCVDEALPLFLIADAGGLGLSPYEAGLLLAAAGAVTALLEQTKLDKVLTESIGMYPALRLSSWTNVPMLLLPLSLMLDDTKTDRDPDVGGMTRSSFAFVVLLFGVPRVFAFVYFSLIGIATGRTVPSCHADHGGHVITMYALTARAVAPVMAGAIMTSLAGEPWAIWAIFGTVGIGAAAFTATLKEAAGGSARNSLALEQRSTHLTQRQRAQVYAKMWEVHYDNQSATVGAKWRRLARKAIVLNRFGDGFLSVGSGVGRLSAGSDGGRLSAGSDGDRPDTISRMTSWTDRQLRPGIVVDDVPFFIMGTHKHDDAVQPSVMTPPLMDALQSELPWAMRGQNYWLRYSLLRDGASLTALEAKAGLSKCTILAVETLDGDILGCFTACPWERRGKYVADGQSFLWRMRSRRSPEDPATPGGGGGSAVEERASTEEDIEVYRWTGENDLCQLFTRDKIAVGGGTAEEGALDGFGLLLDGELQRGSSCPCRTYNNPPLVPGAECRGFGVANVEVWALTPFLFEADAERSERSLQHREMNELKTTSDHSPWSQFL